MADEQDLNRAGGSGSMMPEGDAARKTKTGEKLGEVVEGMAAVFDTQDEAEAEIVKGLLESAGIEAVINSIDTQQDIFPGVGGVVVLVPQDQVEDARQVITAGQNTPEEDLNNSSQ